jgi:hypothetical protein
MFFHGVIVVTLNKVHMTLSKVHTTLYKAHVTLDKVHMTLIRLTKLSRMRYISETLSSVGI